MIDINRVVVTTQTRRLTTVTGVRRADHPLPERFLLPVLPRVSWNTQLLEQNDEWALQRKYLQLEGLQSLSKNQTTKLSAVIS